MLKSGIRYIILLFVGISCRQEQSNAILFYEVSKNQIGYGNYRSVLLKLNDSITHWKLNKVSFFSGDSNICENFLDTLLCFNNKANRFVTCILTVSKNKANPTGVLNYFFGEKQNDQWYFFPSSTSVFIPNSLKVKKDKLFFDYEELHDLALQNVYNGYLLTSGQINEAWFNSHFENVGWGDINDQSYFDRYFKGKRYTNLKDFYKACHLVKVKNNWAYRDTSLPVVPLPIKNLP